MTTTPSCTWGKTGSSGLDASNYGTVALFTQRARTLSSQLASALRGDSHLQTFKPFFQESKDGSLFEKDSELYGSQVDMLICMEILFHPVCPFPLSGGLRAPLL